MIEYSTKVRHAAGITGAQLVKVPFGLVKGDMYTRLETLSHSTRETFAGEWGTLCGYGKKKYYVLTGNCNLTFILTNEMN